ncbi:MAG: hypothetical protein ACPGYV_12795 [Phycisphaeraceae bacterium]
MAFIVTPISIAYTSGVIVFPWWGWLLVMSLIALIVWEMRKW